MKDFIKFTFAAILGFFISIAGVFFVFFLFVFILISFVGKEESYRLPDKCFIKLKLDYPMPERTDYNNPFGININSSMIGFGKRTGLNEILRYVKKAETDKLVKGIFLDLNNFSVSDITHIEELRNSLLEFRKSGKKVYAHANYLSQSAYYLATAADKIFISPEGEFEFKGLSAEIVFFKKTLESLNIKTQIVHYGKYKSAIEPFKFDKMSEANKEQTLSILNSMNEYILANIEKARNVPSADLKYFADNLSIMTPADAYSHLLVDSICYRSQVTDYIKFADTTDYVPEIVDFQDYVKTGIKSKNRTSERIAVVYALGEITRGPGDETEIGIDNIIDALNEARNDDNVKAIVLRIDSPGGDPLTSDIIWNEIRNIRQVKPIVVSMAEVAASGGYYIACGADQIVVEPTTITGSIGVFGIIPNMQDFFNNKLGITFDRVKTGKYSDFGTVTRPLTDYEIKILQKEVDRIYLTFVSRVSEGRNLSFEEVDEIGQGRIWSGIQAVQLGLADTTGGINTAIELAGKLAGTRKYKIYEYPTLQLPFEKLISSFESEVSSYYMKKQFGESAVYIKYIDNLMNSKGIMAKMPFEIRIH